MNSNEIGRITEAKVLSKLVELGKHVLIPFSNIGRYDLLVDNKDGTFTRIECKTGNYKNGFITFNTSSSDGYTRSKDYNKDADLFGVWCRDTGGIYFIPVKNAPKSKMRIKLDGKQTKASNIAKNYINFGPIV